MSEKEKKIVYNYKHKYNLFRLKLLHKTLYSTIKYSSRCTCKGYHCTVTIFNTYKHGLPNT